MPLFEMEFVGFGVPGSFALRKCAGCGLLFNSPRLSDSEIANLYDRSYYLFNRPEATEFRRVVNVYHRTVAILEREITPKTVLEVGSAKGYLLAIMRQMGWQVQGVELSRPAARHARRRFSVPTFAGTIETYAADHVGGRFPLILAVDVLEHVPYPTRFISSIGRLVGDKGILIIDTPNGGSDNILTEGGCWPGFNPFHVFLFTRENLTALLDRHGFSVEKAFTYGNERRRGARRPLPPGKPETLLKKLLRGAHLLGLARGFLRSIRAVRDWSARARLLAKTAHIAESAPPYRETPDSVGPLSAGCKGDNLVVVARRRP